MRGFVAAEEGLSVGTLKRTDLLLLDAGGILGGVEREYDADERHVAVREGAKSAARHVW